MKFGIVLAIFLIIGAQFAFAADPKDVDRVASKLSCFCGTCPHLVVTQCGCSSADKIKTEVASMLDKGMSDKQIVQSFVDRYGNTVLSAPPRSGFNLTAYMIPFAAFLLGGTVLVAFLKHQKNGKNDDDQGGPDKPQSGSRKMPIAPEDEYYGEILSKELDRRK